VTSAAGTYRFVAAYSGDANNVAVTAVCNLANESVVVSPATPAIVTHASGPAGSPLTDTATLTGGSAPTGTITFTVFGPNNATCTGTPVFTSTKTVTGNGNYTSDGFTTGVPGTYNFVAVYSGDANNNAAATACGDPGENVTVSCTTTITGTSGPVVAATGTVCIINAHVNGGVTVQKGVNLVIENSTISGAITANTPGRVRICGTTTRGSVTVTGATGFVLIGGDGDDNCPPNTILGSLSVQNNHAGLEVIANTISGALINSGNSGAGPLPEDTAPDVNDNHHH
jgi:hypothetical protein